MALHNQYTAYIQLQESPLWRFTRVNICPWVFSFRSSLAGARAKSWRFWHHTDSQRSLLIFNACLKSLKLWPLAFYRHKIHSFVSRASWSGVCKIERNGFNWLCESSELIFCLKQLLFQTRTKRRAAWARASILFPSPLSGISADFLVVRSVSDCAYSTAFSQNFQSVSWSRCFGPQVTKEAVSIHCARFLIAKVRHTVLV